MTKTVEVFFEDIRLIKQTELLRAAKARHPSDMNWDTIPIFVYEVEE
jgi:hypothetical protein